MATWIIVMISPPPPPGTAQPRIRPLSASTTAFMKPRVSAVSMARMPAPIGSVATRTARPPRPRLALRQPRAAELRVDEHRVRNDPVPCAHLLVPDEVRAQHAIVVVGQVRERRTALHVTHRVDARHAGLQELVHHDETPVVQPDAR